MNHSSINRIMASLLIIGCAQHADAGIIATSGAVIQITPPASVEGGALESDSDIRVFAEKSNLTLAQSFAVNIKNPGTYSGLAGPTGSLAAGLVIDSYMFHTDHVGIPGGQSYDGSITFDTDILAVITGKSRLDSSDPVVGLPTVAYPTGVSSIDRGTLDSTGAGDVLTLSGNRRTFTFHISHSSDNIEQFRIITEAVPEPASALLVMLGGLALGIRRRR